MKKNEVPQVLRNWFVVHFVADMLFAIPLMIAPKAVLGMVGWEVVDPFATRLVAAALFGIGIESYLGRNRGRDAFLGMLTLKVIWSSAAVLGIAWTLLDGYQGERLFPSITLITFLLFNVVWVYWRRRLSQAA
jgi:hypothetical protein